MSLLNPSLVFDHRFFDHVNAYRLQRQGQPSKGLQLASSMLRSSLVRLPLGLVERILSALLSLRLPVYSDLVLFVVNQLPGLPHLLGCYLRALYYRGRLEQMAPNVLIESNVSITHPEAVSLDSFAFLDKNVILAASKASIGKRVHIAPNCIVTGGGECIVEDYAAIAFGAVLITATESLKQGTRLGPMIPAEHRSVMRGRIVIEKDAFITANVTVLPNTIVEEGAVVSPGAVISGRLRGWWFHKASGEETEGRERTPIDRETEE